MVAGIAQIGRGRKLKYRSRPQSFPLQVVSCHVIITSPKVHPNGQEERPTDRLGMKEAMMGATLDHGFEWYPT
jgi:hypothetical protein